MGKPQAAPAFSPEVLEGFRQRLAGLEALGIDTTRLQEILEEEPASFEAAAEEALRRELSGGEPSEAQAPPAEPPAAASFEEPPAPETQPAAAVEAEAQGPLAEVAMEELPAILPAEPLQEPAPTPLLPAPEPDEISELERKLAEALEAPAIADYAPEARPAESS